MATATAVTIETMRAEVNALEKKITAEKEKLAVSERELEALMSYRLDDPGIARKSLAERFGFGQGAAEKKLEAARLARLSENARTAGFC